jgi:hypothetical protein
MDEYADRAQRYRQRADELRAILPDMRDQMCRGTVMKIAEGYDHLTVSQDQLGEESRARRAL